MKVEEIAEVVAKLLPDQLARFRRWLKPDCVAAVYISLTVESAIRPVLACRDGLDAALEARGTRRHHAWGWR